MQAGVTPQSRTRLSIEFSDTNKVTYCEKLLMRKYQEGSMDSKPQSNSLMDHGEINETGKGLEPLPAISQYNVFYDTDELPADKLPNEDGEEIINVEPVFSDEDFGDCKPSLRASIEEVSFKKLENGKDASAVDESKLECPKLLSRSEKPVVNLPASEKPKVLPSASRELKQHSDTSTNDATRKLSAKKKGKGGKRSKKGGDRSSSSKARVASSNKPEIGNSQLPDLTESVKAAWKSSSQSNLTPKPLSYFFLHGVQPVEGAESEETSPQPDKPSKVQSDGDVTFSLGSTVWLPHSSTVQEDEPPPSHATSEAALLPPSSRPSTSQGRDRYYDDSDDSDSEPENEREEFISSRLGMARDSVEWKEARSASTTPLPDPEEEERVERDRADYEALEDLAWELASTVECEGRLTRNEEELDSEEEGGGSGTSLEHREAVATPTCIESGRDQEGIAEGGILDMAKVMSDFELYQKNLMEADSD